VDAALFTAAEFEVSKMLDSAVFSDFLQRSAHTNLSTSESNGRIWLSLACIAVSVIMTLTLWLVNTSVSRYYRLFTLPFNFSFAMFLVSGLCKT